MLKPGSGTHRRESTEVQSCGVTRFIHVYVIVTFKKILLLLNKTENKKHLKSILHLYSTVETGMYLSFRAER